jgi:DNA-binding transcriptional MerR regulator
VEGGRARPADGAVRASSPLLRRDRLALAVPPHRRGHRLYTAGDGVRLQRIKSLRALGFTLWEVREYLDGSDVPPERVIQLHLARLKERIELQRRLCDRLEKVATRLRSGEGVSSERFVETVMEVINMSESLKKYYTLEQLEYLEERRRKVGEERVRAAEAEWAELMEQVRAEMEAGTDPSDERVQVLAARWMGLVGEFTGGDPGIERSLGNMWQQEENIHGIDTGEVREMGEYVSRALASRDA